MKSVKLLLLENVDNLGIVGDVVDVKPGYARNFLLPRGLASPPTEGAIERLAARRAEVEKELAELAKQQQSLIEKIDGYELTVMRAANDSGVIFAGVSQHDIGEALREEGFDIEDRYVRIGEQIKRLDSYAVPIVINKDLKAEIKLWVVSDKPVEDLDTEPEQAGEEAEAGETAADEPTVDAVDG